MYISKKKQAILDAFETEKEKQDYLAELRKELKEYHKVNVTKLMQRLIDACKAENETEFLMNLFARLQKPDKLPAKPKYQKQTEEQKQEKKMRTIEREKEYVRQYYLRNKDNIRKSAIECRQSNPEKFKEYDALYRKKNAEKIKETKVKYYKENSGKVKECSKKYYVKKKSEKQLIETI